MELTEGSETSTNHNLTPGKYPKEYIQYLIKLVYLDRFSKNIQMSIFLKIHPLGVELFHVDRRKDGQTDMAKLIFAFGNFTNAPDKAMEHG
jgi:hypothetical protein